MYVMKKQLFFMRNIKCYFEVNSKKNVSFAVTWRTFLSFSNVPTATDRVRSKWVLHSSSGLGLCREITEGML